MDGRFARTSYFARPTGMANLNNEGFTLAPQAECVNGLKPTFYADDSFTDGHAIRTGKINCTVPQVKDPTPTPTPTPARRRRWHDADPAARRAARPHGAEGHARLQGDQDAPPRRQAQPHRHAQRARRT